MLGGIGFQLGTYGSHPFCRPSTSNLMIDWSFGLPRIQLLLVVIVVFSICALEFVIRYIRRRPLHVAERNNEKHPITDRGELTGKLKIMLLGLLFSTIVLFIR
jgi:Na+/melibiose symporter-like transporter